MLLLDNLLITFQMLLIVLRLMHINGYRLVRNVDGVDSVVFDYPVSLLYGVYEVSVSYGGSSSVYSVSNSSNLSVLLPFNSSGMTNI